MGSQRYEISHSFRNDLTKQTNNNATSFFATYRYVEKNLKILRA